ncbi:uncharacterized mitochondrial protein AtMg00860-like [Solanum stenotomum]|uniref:uncharacterized mitochondrial protein AtMg00860-like n=1 Tax=Solanum stenotomum TaxID=172797 RepID=UPI0020D026DF|nr:uncharacterized mitochondrial protein AtMg00860-like [Solanum stenotomum]
MGTTTFRMREFTRMNPLEFHGSKVEKDHQQFIGEVYKVLMIMHGSDVVGKAELAAYQLKGVSQISFNQWKDERAKDAGPLDWEKFKVYFFDRSAYEHTDHLRIVLQILKDRELFAKFSKCEFWLRSVAFLGHISGKDIEVDPKKMDAVKSWLRTLSPSDIRSFLDLVGYYRRFVKGFSSIASPLTTLTQKKVKFIWSNECEKSFQELKDRLTSAPVLNLPEGTYGFVVYFYASRIGLGCFLIKNGKVIAYTYKAT